MRTYKLESPDHLDSGGILIVGKSSTTGKPYITSIVESTVELLKEIHDNESIDMNRLLQVFLEDEYDDVYDYYYLTERE